MHDRDGLKQILASTRHLWDRADTRPAVRQNFEKVINCRTAALGAEVYASEEEEKLVCHSCKSRVCSSCGHRATLLWQRERWADLPDIRYAGIVLTMPDVLWPIFQGNRHLLHDLPALGAAAIQQWVKAKYGVRVLLIVVPHSFGRHLNFNTHLHILVSAGGLQESEGRWIAVPHFDQDELMEMWRDAVITFLLEALKLRVISSPKNEETLRGMLTAQSKRRWNIFIRALYSKKHFFEYAGRYARHPPIAEHRFLKITGREVQFRTKDLKLKKVVTSHYSIEEFVAVFAEHVPDHYRHAVRHFGLLAPRSKGRTYAAVFALLGQKKRSRPQRLNWRNSLRKYFGVDPLIDSRGQRMSWSRRLKPVIP